MGRIFCGDLDTKAGLHYFPGNLYQAAMTPWPVIRDTSEVASPCCPPKAGLKELHRVHRTLPPFILENNDPEVLQDEAGGPIRDEITNGFIYDNLKAA